MTPPSKDSLEARIVRLETRQDVLWRFMMGTVGTVLLCVVGAALKLVVSGAGR